MSVFGAIPHTAHAQTIDPATKLASDLVSALNSSTSPKALSEGLVLRETDVQAYSATGGSR
jgi:hypothetical protein